MSSATFRYWKRREQSYSDLLDSYIRLNDDEVTSQAEASAYEKFSAAMSPMIEFLLRHVPDESERLNATELQSLRKANDN